jgi:hypothetical protein
MGGHLIHTSYIFYTRNIQILLLKHNNFIVGEILPEAVFDKMV